LVPLIHVSGKVASVHGSSPHLALVQIMLLVKQSEAGQSLQTQIVWNLLYSLVDPVDPERQIAGFVQRLHDGLGPGRIVLDQQYVLRWISLAARQFLQSQ
jgi:hypothetical protein